jgi:hypothetical protein
MTKLFFSVFLFLSVFIFAQNGFSINGTILNLKKEQALDIYLYNEKNQLVKSTILQEGKFQFVDLKPGVYHFQIGSGEFSQSEKPFSLEKNINIEMNYPEKNIEEVVLQGKKNKFKIENSNITYEITDTPLGKLPTSTELLSKLPFVMMDANGEGLSFVGKGIPLLYVDQQKVDFNTLSAISVDDIKSVEIIRNPSAKYESDGKAVIKVNLKKSKRDGTSIKLSETATFQKKFSNYLNVNFQQKKNKTEWKLNAAYNQINHWESNSYDYSVPTKNISSNYVIQSITKRPQTTFGASLYQELNDDGDYVSIGINGNFRPDKGDNNTQTLYSENGSFTDVKTLNHQDRNRATINSIFNYNKKITSWNANLFAGLQYKRESDNVDYNFFNSTNNSDYEFNQFRKQLYAGNVYSGRVDFEKSFNKKYTLELGGSYTSAKTSNNNKTDFPTLNTQYFKYKLKENNLASYLNLGYNKNKWTIKGGLRMETTHAKGFNETVNATEINRNYVDWFPNAEISYEHNENYTFSLNFRRSIDRPNYNNLSSIGLYGSPYVEYSGNPELIPTYTNTLSMAVNLKKWSLNASFYTAKNPMGYTLTFDEAHSISRFTIINFEKEIGTSLGLDFPFQVKKWTSQNSLSLNYDKTEDSLAILKKSTPYLYFSTNNTVVLWKYLSFLLDGSYITKRTEGLYENNAVCLVNIGLSSSISNFDFTFRYNDIFNQMNYVQKISYNKMVSKGTFYGNTPTISLGIKYNFGTIKKSSYKETVVNETSNRL